jgi:hypothetical protein
MKLEFSQQIFKKYSSNLIKIRPLGAELFHADGAELFHADEAELLHADGRTDGYYEAHSRFSQFWERTYQCFRL